MGQVTLAVVVQGAQAVAETVSPNSPSELEQARLAPGPLRGALTVHKHSDTSPYRRGHDGDETTLDRIRNALHELEH